MSLFYNVSDKELLAIRNKIFLESAITALQKNGFEQSPFSNSWFGKNNLGDYTYVLCRLSANSHIEVIEIHISKGDNYIKFFLNIFKLTPSVSSLTELQGLDGIQFSLLPNSLTQMQLRSSHDYKGMPLFYMLFCPEHKIGIYYSKNGLEDRILELKELIKKDLTNIDSFIRRWHELHKPLITNWKGEKIDM